MSRWPYVVSGISDDCFVRGDVPMTKAEVRAVTLSKLRLKEKSVVVDIGAGTGSISIECARLATQGHVYAVEANSQGIALLQKNKQTFELDNLSIIQGMAPLALAQLPKLTHAFIGGSKGQLTGIFDWLDSNLEHNGVVVANFITPENLALCLQEVRIRAYHQLEIVHVSVARGRNIGHHTLMQGQNPVYVVSALKV